MALFVREVFPRVATASELTELVEPNEVLVATPGKSLASSRAQLERVLQQYS